MADRSRKILLFSRYLEGGLSPPERQAVEVHFRVCAVCRQELTWLCQTVDALQELPLETTPVDFMEKLNRRIERETEPRRLQHPEVRSHTLAVAGNAVPDALSPPSGLGERLRAILTPWMHHWWRSLCFPLYTKVPIYTGAVVLGLATLLLRASPEKAKATPAPPAPSPLVLSEPLSQGVAGVAGETNQPVDIAVSTTGKLAAPVASLAPPTDTPSVVEALAWRVGGSEPAALREQVKALAGQMAGVVIVKEEELLLLLSLPTRGLSTLRQELTKLGEVSISEADAAPNAPTTLLQVTFVRQLPIFPPAPERLPSRS